MDEAYMRQLLAQLPSPTAGTDKESGMKGAEDYLKARKFDAIRPALLSDIHFGQKREPVPTIRWSGGHAIHNKWIMMKVSVHKPGWKRRIDVYFHSVFTDLMRDETLVRIADMIRQRGWKRGIVQRWGGALQLVNFAQHVVLKEGIFLFNAPMRPAFPKPMSIDGAFPDHWPSIFNPGSMDKVIERSKETRKC
jgi:hypothetical protein